MQIYKTLRVKHDQVRILEQGHEMRFFVYDVSYKPLQIQYLDDSEDKSRIFYIYDLFYYIHYSLWDGSGVSTLWFRINMYFLQVITSKWLYVSMIFFWKRKRVGIEFCTDFCPFFKVRHQMFLHTIWESKYKYMLVSAYIFFEGISKFQFKIWESSNILSHQSYKVKIWNNLYSNKVWIWIFFRKVRYNSPISGAYF